MLTRTTIKSFCVRFCCHLRSTKETSKQTHHTLTHVVRDIDIYKNRLFYSGFRSFILVKIKVQFCSVDAVDVDDGIKRYRIYRLSFHFPLGRRGTSAMELMDDDVIKRYLLYNFSFHLPPIDRGTKSAVMSIVVSVCVLASTIVTAMP